MNLHIGTLASSLFLTTSAALASTPAVPAATTVELATTPFTTDSLEITDAPIGAEQAELLLVAFEAASAIPLDPHGKDRSRTQLQVLDAFLELDQPGRALELLPRIEGWRRGAGYADLAEHLVRAGNLDAAQFCLERAREVAEQPLDDVDQEWRTDRVRAKCAEVLVLLDRVDDATAIMDAVVESERPRIAEAKAWSLAPEELEAEFGDLREAIEGATFDETQAAFGVRLALYSRQFADTEKRAEHEAALRATWKYLPVIERIALMEKMVVTAVEHGDLAVANGLVDELRPLVEEQRWLPEDRVPLRARLAVLDHRAGNHERALSDAGRALALFEESRPVIYDVFRGEALRPLAEAYYAMGDEDAARLVMGMALEEGASNPNARPRAMDLAANCASMALIGLVPDAVQRERIAEIRSGLKSPW